MSSMSSHASPPAAPARSFISRAFASDSGKIVEGDFLTAAQFARRLGVSRETVRRLAITGALPHTIVCQGTRKTTRRYPRRFAEEFAASGLEVADLAAFAAAWRARVTAPAR